MKIDGEEAEVCFFDRDVPEKIRKSYPVSKLVPAVKLRAPKRNKQRWQKSLQAAKVGFPHVSLPNNYNT